MDEEENEENKWNDDNENKKKECDSNCFINRSLDGEAYPYPCVLSSNLTDWDDPMTLQVILGGFENYKV